MITAAEELFTATIAAHREITRIYDTLTFHDPAVQDAVVRMLEDLACYATAAMMDGRMTPRQLTLAAATLATVTDHAQGILALRKPFIVHS